jgi:hypothetical protein
VKKIVELLRRLDAAYKPAGSEHGATARLSKRGTLQIVIHEADGAWQALDFTENDYDFDVDVLQHRITALMKNRPPAVES